MSSVITAGSLTADFSGVEDYKGKRAFDLLVAVILGILFFPVILLAVLAVRLTNKGEVFFLQERLTKNRKKFTIYKIRTMNEDGQHIVLGSFLRKYAIDELPQLLNVIQGDMSLVGPRPHMCSQAQELEKLHPKYKLRYNKKPGIAGLSQMYGFTPSKGPSVLERMIETDLRYVEESSLVSDVRILFVTSKVFILGH